MANHGRPYDRPWPTALFPLKLILYVVCVADELNLSWIMSVTQGTCMPPRHELLDCNNVHSRPVYSVLSEKGAYFQYSKGGQCNQFLQHFPPANKSTGWESPKI